MVKFARQLDAQLIPEWKDAFVNYRQLKKNIKTIKISRRTSHDRHSSLASGHLDAFRRISSSIFGSNHHHHPQAEDEELYEMEAVHSREHEVKCWFENLDEELEKVNKFYEGKETEFLERGEILGKQLRILLDLKNILHQRRRIKQLATTSNRTMRNNISAEEETEDSTIVSTADDEVLAVLERNGVTTSAAQVKAKKGGKPRTTSLRIDIPATTRTITAATSVIWEDIVNANYPRRDYVTRKKIQCAHKMIRAAYMELYRGLGFLVTYSSLNMMAFKKILKKFDKVTTWDCEESGIYMEKVKGSHFVTSDKVVRLCDEVESLFIKHFADNDRKKAMKFLQPQQPKQPHTITFLAGLFTGSFVTLFIIYAILAHLSGVFSSSTHSNHSYVKTVYPIFSMFALISLHIFVYGCNLYAWKCTRINNNFIFDFSPTTALKHTDAFLISSSIMTVVVASLVVHLLLVSPHHVHFIPGILVVGFIGLLFCPFNICYRSTRACFLRVIRNIVLSPFYKVFMADFFMADQLTSQIPLLRHMEFTACFFIAGGFKAHTYETCTINRNSKLVFYIISFLPYYWRGMQCMRRYVEEGYDMKHIANACKYISAMIAAAAKIKYASTPTSALWLAVFVATSCLATLYQCYWDFFHDWGFFQVNSKNKFLRDDLVMKTKAIYYASIGVNLALRLAWIDSYRSGSHRLVDFILACAEVVRRGHWNYYRLENEHLNNVGKFRAVRAVPLPFRDVEYSD